MFRNANFLKVIGAFAVAASVALGSFTAISSEPQSVVTASSVGTNDSQWG